MTVVRVRIQKDFTVLYNGVLENPRLSFKAKGLWAYCMSRPDNWHFHVNHLATVSKEGIDAVYSAIKELEAEGLVEKTQKNQGGVFGPVDYTIYPYAQEIQKILPLRDFPQTEDPQTENPALTRTDPLGSVLEPPSPGAHNSSSSSSSSSLLIASPEEEEEIQRRLKNRPKGCDPIVSMKAWRETVLEEMRNSAKEDLNLESLIERHRSEASSFERKSGNGRVIMACCESLEVSSGMHCSYIPYDLPEEEWRSRTAYLK